MRWFENEPKLKSNRIFARTPLKACIHWISTKPILGEVFQSLEIYKKNKKHENTIIQLQHFQQAELLRFSSKRYGHARKSRPVCAGRK